MNIFPVSRKATKSHNPATKNLLHFIPLFLICFIECMINILIIFLIAHMSHMCVCLLVARTTWIVTIILQHWRGVDNEMHLQVSTGKIRIQVTKYEKII